MDTLNKFLVFKLTVLQIVIIAISNYTVQFTGTVLGYAFTWGMFVFPFIVLTTDLTVRLSGQTTARRIISMAFIPAIIISAYLANWRIGIASGLAYIVGQLLDIFVFQKVRENSQSWWAAPLVSSFFANIIDTYTFYAMAFHRSADTFMSENWRQLASLDLAFKVVVSIILFLPLYGLLLKVLTRKIDVNAI